MKTYRIAAIPGDGIGKEVIPAGQEGLLALAATGSAFRFAFEPFDWGGDYYRRHGLMMPADGLDALRAKDAILFGWASDADIPDHVTLWSLRLAIYQGFVMRFAFRLAQGRPRKQLTLATNLHAGILSDLAAALAGSLGIAPTGNIDPERRYPSMFEPIHGSAFVIMGQGLANPIGTFWSCVMLLEHLGEADAARRLMDAIESVTADPALHTGDLGGSARIADVTRAVVARLAR
jgi:isocitrate/isopropylmalate dehydrogenase